MFPSFPLCQLCTLGTSLSHFSSPSWELLTAELISLINLVKDQTSIRGGIKEGCRPHSSNMRVQGYSSDFFFSQFTPILVFIATCVSGLLCAQPSAGCGLLWTWFETHPPPTLQLFPVSFLILSLLSKALTAWWGKRHCVLTVRWECWVTLSDDHQHKHWFKMIVTAGLAKPSHSVLLRPLEYFKSCRNFMLEEVFFFFNCSGIHVVDKW